MDLDLATRQDAGGVVGEERTRRKKVQLVQEAIHGLLEEKRRKWQQQGEDKGSMLPREEEEDILYSLFSKVFMCIAVY